MNKYTEEILKHRKAIKILEIQRDAEEAPDVRSKEIAAELHAVLCQHIGTENCTWDTERSQYNLVNWTLPEHAYWLKKARVAHVFTEKFRCSVEDLVDFIDMVVR